MGAQSFDASLLRWLGRLHSPDDVERAIGEARAAGFASVNLDLMYALPGQSLATWEQTLERACALAPDHLSLYSLIVEEGTPLATWVRQGKVRPAEDDLAADMYELAEVRLGAVGYQHYEISNWARPGHQCAHNLTYWRNLPYIGLGAGAHGWFGRHRFVEARPIRAYLARVWSAGNEALSLPAAAIVENEEIAPVMEMAETAMLALRLAEGLDTAAFAARFSQSFTAVYGEQVRELLELGLLEHTDGRLRLTGRGRLLGNEAFERFLPDD
jgi:oxygen-independent coproporphyrinogen-3 oxidase